MNPITKLEIYAAIGLMLVLAMLGAYFKGKHDGGQIVQLKFDVFVSEVKAAGAKAEADKAIKEKADAEKITAAVAGRDVALARLRDAQASAASRRLPSNPAAPSGSNKVCFSSTAYNAAFKQFGDGLNKFLQSATGFAIEGDTAQLDAQTLVNAWPTQAIPLK